MINKQFKKILSIIIVILIILTSTQTSFAHNAVYIDFMVGTGFDYRVILRDDIQTNTEAAHYEWSSEGGGYFFDAGKKDTRSLFVADDGMKDKETKVSGVKHRTSGYINDPTAQADRAKYYEKYKRPNSYTAPGSSKLEDSTASDGLSKLGKVFTFPPTNAQNTDTKKILHFDSNHKMAQEIYTKSAAMIQGFNQLLRVCGTSSDAGAYTSVDTDFLAVSELLSDAILNDVKHVVIPVSKDKYHSVHITPSGRSYNAEVVRSDDKSYKIVGAIRTVNTGFKRVGDKGDFKIAGSEVSYKTTSTLEGVGIIKKVTGWFKNNSVPTTQKFDFREDFTLSMAIIAANTKYSVDGYDAKNSYMARNESILAREVSKFLNDLLDSLTSLLKLQDYDELIYNRGIRNSESYVIKDSGEFEEVKSNSGTPKDESLAKNDPYILGMYKTSWHKVIKSFNSVFMVMAIMIIAISLVKLLLNVQTIALSPHSRTEAKQSILNYAIVAFLMPLTWVIFYTLGALNMYIVNIFGAAVSFTPIDTLSTSTSGTLGSIIISLTFFSLLIYFNVVYIFRSINIAVLMATSPVMVASLALGGKFSSNFDTWLKELSANIFLQAFHSFILTFIVSVQASSNTLEQLIMVTSLIPLTSLFRSLFMGSSRTISEAERRSSHVKGISDNIMSSGAKLGMGATAAVVGYGVDKFSNKKISDYTKQREDILKDKDLSPAQKAFEMGRLDNKEKATKKNADSFKKASTGAINAFGNAAMIGVTDGKSMQGVISGATEAFTGAASGIASGAKSIYGGITGSLSDKFDKVSGKEIAVNKNELGSDIESIESNKETEQVSYNPKNQELMNKIKSINKDAGRPEEEKAQLMKDAMIEAGYDIRKDSTVSYNSRKGTVDVSHKNTSGVEVKTMGDQLLVTKFGKAQEVERATVSQKSLAEREAAFAGEPTLGATVNAQDQSVNVTDSTLYNSMHTPLSEARLNNDTGKHVFKTKGTAYENVKSVSLSQDGNSIVTVKSMSQGEMDYVSNIMNNSSLSDSEKIEKRDEFISNTYGKGYEYSGNGEVTVKEVNPISNLEYIGKEGNNIVFKTTGSADYQIDRSPMGTHSSSEVLDTAMNTNNEFAKQKVTVSPKTFGLNDNIFDYNSVSIIGSDSTNSEVIFKTTNDVTNDLQTQYDNWDKEERDKLQGTNGRNYTDRELDDLVKPILDKKLSEYAHKEYQIDNINYNKDDGFYTSIGKNTTSDGYEYDKVSFKDNNIVFENTNAGNGTGNSNDEKGN